MDGHNRASLARRLRRSMTDAETRLWQHLRNRRLLGWKFRRQVPVGVYVADFMCVSAHLIIEVDGGQHVDRAIEDQQRTDWLAGQGYRILRFWNDDVLMRTDVVLEQIVVALARDDF